MPMDDQRFISRGFPAPPLPEDFPVRLGRLEDRSGLPLKEFARRWAAARRPGDGVAPWRAAHRPRAAGHDGVVLLGGRRGCGDAHGPHPALALPGAGLTQQAVIQGGLRRGSLPAKGRPGGMNRPAFLVSSSLRSVLDGRRPVVYR